MRVAVYYNNRDVRIAEAPLPRIGPGELLVRVHASGICGSDLMEWYRIEKAPLVLGHEIAGEVVKAGEGVERYRAGDRVVVSHHVPCQRCRYCRGGHPSVCDTLRSTHLEPGGFAEYVRVPRLNVELGTFPVPASLSFEEASFAEPLGCVLRAQRAAAVGREKSVLVIGSGISGLLHVQLARSLGAAAVFACDLNRKRLEAAAALGADATIEAGLDLPERLRQRNERRLADVVIVCAGSASAAEVATRCVERGGTLLFFAPTPAGTTVPLPLFDFWRDEIAVLTSYAASPEDIRQALDLLASGAIKARPMISHRLGLADTGLGFRLMQAGESLKVIVEPQRP
jgi:L-iditol 2-dehydrogenase